MTNVNTKAGSEELRDARRESRSLYWTVGIFSFFANLLMLTGPIFMLQVYDRVLGSRSEATLVALALLVAFLYGIMGIMDYTRGRIMARVGARFQSRLDRRVFDAVVRKSAIKSDSNSQTGLADLESVQRLMSSPVLMGFFDMPWTPIFLAGITLFHPWLGLMAMSGGAILILITVVNQILSKGPLGNANRATHRSVMMSDEIRNEAEMVQSMGMRGAAFDRWVEARDQSLSDTVSASDVGGGFTALTKTLRLFLQSAILGLGAYLVLQNQVTPGAMIAASILMGRALAPIELVIGQWPLVQRAVKGWSNLTELLSEVPAEVPRTALPKPAARLEAQAVTLIPPGERRAALRNISFSIMPGEAVGVIGPSGAGKSTLARALTGVWRPAGGTIRLGGAGLDQYDADVLGQHIGYLPQRVQLFEGTIAQNIARLSPEPDAEKVVAAAKKAAAHEMIVELPDGYDTRVSSGGGRLSGGQMQRIGLARAMYDDPVVVILDEPNSNLDNEGSKALNQAVRALKENGKSILIMAHRPAAIVECDKIMVLDSGALVAFGPKDQVMRDTVQNHEQIQRAPALGGVQ
jgi:ATP-binding cassette subfamily C protein